MLPHNPDSSLVTQLSSVTLDDPEGPPQMQQVVGARRHKRFVLLRFEGVETVEQARSLVGRSVSISLEELPPAGPAEVYHVHLVGCRVETDRGVDLGVVEAVLSTPGTDSCVVRGRHGEVLVPLVADVIVRIDVERRYIVVRALPGLLDA
jgi:16S rRNA processing protein RimM